MGRWPRFWRRFRGTRGRLVGLQVLMLAAAALIADVSIYQLVSAPLVTTLEGSLYDQLHSISGGLTVEQGSIRFTNPELPGEGADGAAIEAIVTNAEGRVLLTGQRQSLASAEVAVIARQVAASQATATIDTTDVTRNSRRVYAEWVIVGEAPNQARAALIVSRSSADLAAVNRRLLLTLGLGSVLLVLVGGALAYSVTSRALRPVGVIAALARTISEQDLHRRVEVRAPDDELGDLVRTFNLMLARLEATFDSLNRFTADASHELRAPLSVITSQVEVALSRPREPADYERVLRSVLDQVGHLTRISAQLLLIARADAGELHPDAEAIDVVDFVHEVAARWQPTAESRRIELEVEVPDGAGELDADRALTQRVIDNLLDNACRHAPELSTVHLAAGRDDADWVFDVSDAGPGIPEDQRERIFERFGRADSARSRGAGAGLGLALGAAIAAAHGGSLELVDRPGPGSTLRLRLPAVRP